MDSARQRKKYPVEDGGGPVMRPVCRICGESLKFYEVKQGICLRCECPKEKDKPFRDLIEKWISEHSAESKGPWGFADQTDEDRVYLKCAAELRKLMSGEQADGQT